MSSNKTKPFRLTDTQRLEIGCALRARVTLLENLNSSHPQAEFAERTAARKAQIISCKTALETLDLEG